MKATQNASQLYILDGESITEEVNVASISPQTSSTRLWHLRLGHVSKKGLDVLSKAKMLMGDSIEDLGFCEDCVIGKSHRMKFSSSPSQRSSITAEVCAY